MKTGIELIADERQEQIEKHLFTLGRDAFYYSEKTICKKDLIRAAISYLTPSDERVFKRSRPTKAFEQPLFKKVPNTWPWSESAWKPSPDNRIKELQKAGALIAAEIDRLQAI